MSPWLATNWTVSGAEYCRRRSNRRRSRGPTLLIVALIIWGVLDLTWQPHCVAFSNQASSVQHPQIAGVGTRTVQRLFIACTGLGLGFLAVSRIGASRLPESRQVQIRNFLIGPTRVVENQGLADVPCTPSTIGKISAGPWAGVTLVILYVSTDLGVFFAYDAANDDFGREAVLLVSSLSAWVLGCWLSWWQGGEAGLRQAFSFRHWMRLMPIAGCFSLATWSQLNAISRLSPVLVKVLLQLKLPGTVMLSTLFLRQKYSFLQINSLTTIFLAVTAFTCVKVGRLESLFAPAASGGLTTAALGFLFSAMAVLFNVFASMLGELAFRVNADVPYNATVVHMKVGEILMAFFLMSLKPNAPLPLRSLLANPSAMLTGFDMGVWLVVGFLVTDSWVSGLLVKRTSSVVKSVAKCMSLISLYTLSVCVLRTEPLKLIQVILAMLVVNGTVAFSYTSLAKKKHGENYTSCSCGSVAP